MKRIWKFEGFTVCRILGLTLNEDELKKLAKKFRVGNKELHELHGELVSACKTKNPISKQIDKIIREKYQKYTYLTPYEAYKMLKRLRD
ncbi:hypothetical protein DRO97_03525 [Archaeoglobales archaeon]|nr:MAG: hypothetical protein DRO97_03525 [Archaeoglobales archaeon]